MTAARLAEEVGDRVHERAEDLKPRLRGWLHAVTAPLAFFSFLVVLVLADDVRVRLGLAVFMVSAVMLFTISAVYHTGSWPTGTKQVLQRLDHACIFVLIAGSSTPFILLILTGRDVLVLLGVMWGGALLGVLLTVTWRDSPRWLDGVLYLVLGGAPIMFAAEFLRNTPTVPLVLLVAGALIYTLGAAVFASRRPNPSPQFFGFHEVFHALTIAGFFVHYAGVMTLA